MLDTSQFSEAEVRYNLIDPMLVKAKWNLADRTQISFEVCVGSLVDFLKFVMKLEVLHSYDEIVRQAFDAFILEHHYNADKTRFLLN